MFSRIFICAILPGFFCCGSAFAQPPCGFADATGRIWHGEIQGQSYYLVEHGGVLQRVAVQPLQRTVEEEAQIQLARLGLPQKISATSQIVYAISGTCNTVTVQRDRIVLPPVDWRAAVRNAVRDTVIRGFNAADERSRESLENSEFQQLVQQGVEDAFIIALNQLNSVKENASGQPLPTLAGDNSDALADLPFPQDSTEFTNRYAGARWQPAGWIAAGKQLPRPLELSGGFVVCKHLDSENVDIWKGRRLLFADCRFYRFFEDFSP